MNSPSGQDLVLSMIRMVLSDAVNASALAEVISEVADAVRRCAGRVG
jgi:hypothetical protein